MQVRRGIGRVWLVGQSDDGRHRVDSKVHLAIATGVARVVQRLDIEVMGPVARRYVNAGGCGRTVRAVVQMPSVACNAAGISAGSPREGQSRCLTRGAVTA